MKQTTFYTKIGVVFVMLACASVSCSLSLDKPAAASLPQQRFIALMRLYAPENRPHLNEECNTQDKRDAFLRELDKLYRQIIENDDIDTFQTIVDINSNVAASIGAFGVMEIANKNYMIKPSSKHLRERCLGVLAELTSHSSPHVRTAALYSLGVMRQHEFKDFVISRLSDTAGSDLFFPPFIESNYGMDTSVHTQARQALVKMLGKTVASDYIRSAVREAYLKSTVRSEQKKSN